MVMLLRPIKKDSASWTPRQGHFFSERQSAFTLIELLVVIAIIAILAAILFPVFSRAREKARQVSCLSNLRQQGMGLAMYVQDFLAFPPHEGAGWVFIPRLNAFKKLRWFDHIHAYTRNPGIFVCPSVPRKWRFGGPAGRNATYGYNYGYLGAHQIGFAPDICDIVPVMEASILTPANMVAIGDSRGRGDKSCDNDDPDDPDLKNPQCLFDHGYAFDAPYPARCSYPVKKGLACSRPDGRHFSGANFTFVDGHAKWMRVLLSERDIDGDGVIMESYAEIWWDNRWWNGRYPDPFWGAGTMRRCW